MQQPPSLPLLLVLAVLLVLTGCGHKHPTYTPSTHPAVASAPGEAKIPSEQELADEEVVSSTDAATVEGSERTRAHCFHLQPSRHGLCQPQSLIYARCRTGILTCRLGNTNPVSWYACAKQHGYSSKKPVAGSVMIIDIHRERKIYTGHPVYVESVKKNGDGTWTLRISHTNYDRKCHLDQDAKVHFFPHTMTVNFLSGPWAPWAKHLRVLGFIVR